MEEMNVYEEPRMKVIEVVVEKGFASSSTTEGWGQGGSH